MVAAAVRARLRGSPELWWDELRREPWFVGLLALWGASMALRGYLLLGAAGAILPGLLFVGLVVRVISRPSPAGPP